MKASFASTSRAPALALGIPLVLAAALLLPACDTGGNDEGQFQAFVEFRNGGRTTLEGRALFSTRSDGTFTLEFVPRSNTTGFREGVLMTRAGSEGDLPTAGRFGLAPPTGSDLPTTGFAGAVRLGFGSNAPALYYATGGTLTLTAVSADWIEGTFSFNATLVESGGSVDAPLGLYVEEAAFRAEPGPTDRFPL